MPTTTHEPLRYLSAADLAERYGVHKITIHKWARNGVLPQGEMVGPNTRRWRSDVIEQHEAHTRNGAGQHLEDRNNDEEIQN